VNDSVEINKPPVSSLSGKFQLARIKMTRIIKEVAKDKDFFFRRIDRKFAPLYPADADGTDEYS
jgi:hypothetical protein